MKSYYNYQNDLEETLMLALLFTEELKRMEQVEKITHGMPVEITNPCECGETTIVENFIKGIFQCIECGIER